MAGDSLLALTPLQLMLLFFCNQLFGRSYGRQWIAAIGVITDGGGCASLGAVCASSCRHSDL